MKLQIKLIKNELKKLFSKPSSWILVGIFFFYCLVSPIGLKALNEWVETTNNNYITYEMEFKESMQEEFTTKQDETSQLASAIIDEEIKINKELNESLDLRQSWQVDIYDELLQSKEELYIKTLLDNGQSKEKLKNAYDAIGFRSFDIGTISDYTKEEINKKQLDVDRKIELLKSKDSLDYIAYIKETKELEKAELQKQFQEINKVEMPVSEKEQASKAITKSIEQLDKEIADNQYRITNKISYDDSWKDKTLKAVKEKEETISAAIVSEEEYVSKNLHRNQSYEEYKKEFTKNQTKEKESLAVLQDSLDKNQPLYQFEDSARSTVVGQNGLVGTSALILIILAAGIVASEYNKGTIRLLLASPVKRWKILLSKLLCLLVVLVGMILLSNLITIIVSGCLYGFDDLMIPVSYFSGGNVVSTNFILWQLTKCLTLGISAIFLISVTFMLSVLFKNTAIALALPLLFNMVAPIVMIVGSQFKMFFIKYTPIPYLDLSSLIYPNLTNVEAMYRPEMIGTFPQGVIILLGCTVICLMVAFSTFNNREVTN